MSEAKTQPQEEQQPIAESQPPQIVAQITTTELVKDSKPTLHDHATNLFTSIHEIVKGEVDGASLKSFLLWLTVRAADFRRTQKMFS
jgi:hypothetical protein